MQKIALIVGGLVLLVTPDAHAQYLDPGAGSVMIQALIAGLVGAATVLKLYWSKISGFFHRRQKTDRP